MLQLGCASKEAFFYPRLNLWAATALFYLPVKESHRGITKIEELAFKEQKHLSCSTGGSNANLLSPSPSSCPSQGHSSSRPALLLQVTTGT